MLGLRFCARAFSSCGERGPLFIAVRGPLTIAASLVAEHRLQTRRLSNCGSRAYSLRGMWDLPRPGLEPVCPALAGGFSTTAPPGKPLWLAFNQQNIVKVTGCHFEQVAEDCDFCLASRLPWLTLAGFAEASCHAGEDHPAATPARQGDLQPEKNRRPLVQYPWGTEILPTTA